MDNQLQEILDDLNQLQTRLIKYKNGLNVSSENKEQVQKLTDFFKQVCDDRETVRKLLLETLAENPDKKEKITRSLKNYGLPEESQELYSDFSDYLENCLYEFRNQKICYLHDVLKKMNLTEQSEFFNRIQQSFDDDTYENMRKSGFIFEDIAKLDDRSIQITLREIDSYYVVLSLIGADENVKNKIFSNMSKRACSMLQEDIKITSETATESAILEARNRIIAVIYKLQDDGEIYGTFY